MVDYILEPDKIQGLADYADKHELFDLFERLTARLLIEKPSDPLQWAIDYLQQPIVPSIVICGPPSSGTTAICERIAKAFDAVYISTGELLQTAIERQTGMGMQAKPFMERGNLVPDQIMLSLVMQRLQDNDVITKGYVLEGFPRTKEQALAMQIKGLCPAHFVYHLTLDPPPRSVSIEARLIQKNSHTEPSIRGRLAQYHRHLRGVVGCFAKTLRKIVFPEGIVGNEEKVIAEVMDFVGTKKRTHAPRQFRIIVAGLPGSGKSSVAELMQREYGFVHGMSILVFLFRRKLLSLKRFKPFIHDPYGVSDNIMMDLIIRRLKKPDCVNNGWVLEGFPISKAQAEELKKHDIVPNRLIWLRAPEPICRSRLLHRRIDPTTGRIVNLTALPTDVSASTAETWLKRPEDSEESINLRFARYEKTLTDLESFYGYKQKGRTATTTVAMTLPPRETDGIMQEVKADGVGEGDGFGGNGGVRRVFELVEDALLHPVPTFTPFGPAA
ncbi:adenylate kinase-domain-containing protein [Chytridium lagenaria]|nr:adenylate kinase-domain-containing protein [Chytridium lagenaria]